MSNKVKCEWCGHFYDTEKYESCPKCGGVNTSESSQISENNNFKNIKVSQKEKQNLKIPKIIIFLFIAIFIFPVILISFLSFIDNFGYSSYINKAHIYYTDEKPIEVGNSKFYISAISIEEYDYWMVNPYVDMYIEESDYNPHSIDMYLLNGDMKYRLITDNYSFNSDSSISSIHDALKAKGHLRIYTKCDIEENASLSNFDKLIIGIDGEEFEIPLRYSEGYFGSDSKDKNYSISGKVSFGEGNTLYVDGMYTYSSSYSVETDVDLYLETNINDYNSESLEIFLEDDENNLYRLYLEPKYNDIDSINKILKTNLSNKRINFYSFAKDVDFKSLHIIIDGKEDIIRFQ